tara:strand:- start:125 stop:328 length:204 start_codon:yes stop_codon:yes gene_type:complete
MDTFIVNKLNKKKPINAGETKISHNKIVKTHKAFVRKEALKDTKPECIFCDYKKPSVKKSKKSKKIK